jgi:hypothetical protein
VAIDAIKRDSGVGIIIDRVKVSYKETYGAGTFIVRSMHDWKIELDIRPCGLQQLGYHYFPITCVDYPV